MNTTFNPILKQNAYGKNGPADAALEPVEHLSDLEAIPQAYRYQGMTVTVLKTIDNKSIPIEYFLYNGISDWKIKNIRPLLKHASLTTSLPTDYSYYLLGLKAVIKKDETNDNKMTEYQVTKIDAVANTVTWERCDSAAITVEGADMESAGV